MCSTCSFRCLLVFLVGLFVEYFKREPNCSRTGLFLQINAFEVASDAFTTFERLLTKHAVVADFLNAHFQRFFSQYEQLLQSEANYATQRQV